METGNQGVLYLPGSPLHGKPVEEVINRPRRRKRARGQEERKSPNRSPKGSPRTRGKQQRRRGNRNLFTSYLVFQLVMVDLAILSMAASIIIQRIF